MRLHVVARSVGRLALASMLWLSLAARVGEAQATSSKVQPVTRGFRASPDVTMRIYVPSGRIRLSVWDRDSIHVRGFTSTASQMFGGGTRTHVKFGVEPRVSGDSTLANADWEVSVPVGARVWIKMIDGIVAANGTQGELEVYTVRGGVSVRDAAGTTTVESIDAPVTILRSRGDVRVRGSRGAVTMENVEGTLSVATVSGPVFMTSVTSDGRVETIGGEISVTAGSLRGATMELQSHAGAITLTLDAQRSPLLDLSSRAGSVLGDKVAGSAKNGQLVARSFKGRITVKARYITP